MTTKTATTPPKRTEHSSHTSDPDPDRSTLTSEHRLDKDLEETFPASDAPATSGATKIGHDGKEKGVPRQHK